MKQIKIWDSAIRLFHWALVVAIAFSLFSAFQDKIMTGYDTMHLYAGLAVLTLTGFRITWGFIGSETARFSSFIASPRRVLAYLKNQDTGNSVGHNPIGGWSVVLMLILLFLQALMGLFSSDAMFFEGPLTAMAGDRAGMITEWHRIAGYLLIGVIITHLVAVIYYSLVKKITLIKPMITGNKMVNNSVTEPKQKSWLLAVAVLLAIAATVYYMILA